MIMNCKAKFYCYRCAYSQDHESFFCNGSNFNARISYCPIPRCDQLLGSCEVKVTKRSIHTRGWYDHRQSIHIK